MPILADTANEGTETFTLGLTTSTNTTIVRSTATGTIYDDDGGVPVLSTTAQMVNEGDVGTTSMVFTVSVPAIVISAISFHATTHAINATEGVDYTGVDADFAINTASNAVDITVPIIGDTMAEDLESFVLVLSAPMGATISTPMVLGRIKDDDEAPTLTFTPQSDTEGDLGATLQFVPMSLSAPAGHDVTVRIATMSQTAASPDDFAATTGLVRIPAGVDTWECAVPINGDLTTEPDETYRINASMPVNLKLAASSISCTIENDD